MCHRLGALGTATEIDRMVVHDPHRTAGRLGVELRNATAKATSELVGRSSQPRASGRVPSSA
jgi:hypothetical protein